MFYGGFPSHIDISNHFYMNNEIYYISKIKHSNVFNITVNMKNPKVF